MHRYHKLGKMPRKRHTVFRSKEGNIYHEELKGNKGFDGPSALLYHIYPPTEVVSTKVVDTFVLEEDPNAALRMRHFYTDRLSKGGSPVTNRTPLLFNNDVIISASHPNQNDDFYYRNAQADEVVYVGKGSGTLETAYGNMTYGKGDYLVIPRGILHKYNMKSESHSLLIIEGSGEINTPKRYRNEYGQLIERSPYSERDFRVPEKLNTHDEKGEYKILVKQRDLLTEVTLGHHPCDVVGWDGYYYPYAFNINDFEPIVGRIHEPPPVHQTFQGLNFVVCSFCPRPFDFDENSIPAPYNHSNVMSDEVIYYAKDEFMSRKGVEFGSLTLHPDGLTHGPHPGKYEASIGQKWTDELAVMVDTYYPLLVAKNSLDIEDENYSSSWLDGEDYSDSLGE